MVSEDNWYKLTKFVIDTFVIETIHSIHVHMIKGRTSIDVYEVIVSGINFVKTSIIN